MMPDPASRTPRLAGMVDARREEEFTVDVLAEGPSSRLDELERRLWAGPDGARVEAVAATRTVASGEYDGFGIVRG